MPAKGQKLSEEAKKRLSELAKKRTGKNNPFYGKKHSKEAREQMSAARKERTGWEHSEETKRKIGEAHKGREKSEEQKAKQSEAMKARWAEEGTNLKPPPSGSGEDNPFFGKQHTDEVKQRIGDANRGRRHTEEARAKMSKQQSLRLTRVQEERLTATLVGTLKGGEVALRGDLERRAAELLEADERVERFEYETLAVKYEGPTGLRWTVADFRVWQVDGTQRVIEVKSRSTRTRDMERTVAVRKYCQERGWDHAVWDESFLWPESCPRETWECSLPTTFRSQGTSASS